MKTKLCLRTNPGLVGFLCALFCALAAQGATRTWDGGGANNNWSTAANWDGAVSAGDDLVFPGTAPANSLSNTNDFGTSTAFNSITISGTNYTLRGNTIILANGITHTSGGTNTIAMGIQLGQNQTFTATAASGRLIFSSAVLPNGHDLFINANTGSVEITGAVVTVGNVIKNGAGTLRFGGSGNNTYSGATTVNQGLLELNKPAGTTAVTGALIIGDGSGAVGSASVRLLASDQINNTSAVSISADGLLDLNGFSDAIGALTLTGGDVSTGVGTLTLGGDVTSNSSTNQATISGHLSLGSVTRTFNVSANSPNALVVLAQVSGSGGLIKAGSGTMVLGGSNSFSGVVTVNGGRFFAEHSFALGTTNAGTVVQSNATLSVGTGAHVGLESLTLNSAGAVLSSALISPAGANSNSWAGDITLARDTTINVGVNATLNLMGAIGGARALTKAGGGTLLFTGNSNNTYSGTTTVTAGTLALRKGSSPAAFDAVPGDLIIGDNVGAPSNAIVRLDRGLQIARSADVVVNSSGVLEINAGAELIGSLAGTGALEINPNFGLSFGLNNTSTAFSGRVTGGWLEKLGSGVFTLSGNHNFVDFNLRGGSAVFNGTNIGGFSIFTNAVLMAAGTVHDTIDMRTSGSGGGILRPGFSPGLFNTGSLLLSSRATLQFELNGTTPGTGYDQLKVNGSVILSNATLSATLGFASALNNSFTIIDNDGTDAVMSTFAGLPEGATLNVSGTPFRITYAGGSGNDVVLTQLAATQRPLLSIRSSGTTNVLLSWATNFNGFTLEANTNLNTNMWAVVVPAPFVSSTNNVVTNVTSGVQKFYRLRAP